MAETARSALIELLMSLGLDDAAAHLSAYEPEHPILQEHRRDVVEVLSDLMTDGGKLRPNEDLFEMLGDARMFYNSIVRDIESIENEIVEREVER